MKKQILSCALAAALTAGMLSAFPASVSAEINLDDLPTPISSDSSSNQAKEFTSAKPYLDGCGSYDGYYTIGWKPVKNALFYKVYGYDIEKREYVEIRNIPRDVTRCDVNGGYYGLNGWVSGNDKNFARYRVKAATFDYSDKLVLSAFSDSYPAELTEKQTEAFKKSAPKLSQDSLSQTEKKITWNSVKNALIYVVYKRSSGEKALKEVTRIYDGGCSYSFDYAKDEYYAVKAVTIDENGNDIESAVSKELRITPPKIPKPRETRKRYYSTGDAVDCGEGVDYESDEIYDDSYDSYAPAAAVNGYYTPDMEMLNTEEYSKSEETGFKNTATDPVSTFSADVDTASYANLRRLIKDGSRIPEDSVRIEEMLNYFDYGYTKPKGESPFSIIYELSDCPWNKNSKLMMIGVQGKDISLSETPASNLVFLVDTSGSMSSNDKLPLAVESINMLTQTMTDKDRISIVTYSGEESVLIAGAKGNQKNTVKTLTDMLYANGSTNGESGIQAAYAIAEKYFIEGGNNRIIMMTDGDLNVGISSEDELKELIEEKRKSGVYFSVMGFGKGNIKDNKMETLADNGNGSYYYIDTAEEAAKNLIAERNSALYTIAKDVKLQVEFNPKNVKSYRLIGYDNRRLNNEDFENDQKDAGDVGAGDSVTVLYEIVTGDNTKALSLKYQQVSSSNTDEWCTLKIRYKKPSDSKSMMVSTAIKASAYSPADEMSGRMRFACAVAQFGLMLKDSTYKSDANLESVKALLAKNGETEKIGYYSDFKKLVELYEESYT